MLYDFNETTYLYIYRYTNDSESNWPMNRSDEPIEWLVDDGRKIDGERSKGKKWRPRWEWSVEDLGDLSKRRPLERSSMGGAAWSRILMADFCDSPIAHDTRHRPPFPAPWFNDSTISPRREERYTSWRVTWFDLRRAPRSERAWDTRSALSRASPRSCWFSTCASMPDASINRDRCAGNCRYYSCAARVQFR